VFRLVIAVGLVLVPVSVPGPVPGERPPAYALRTIPGSRVLTPGGDALGYAPVPRPYVGANGLSGMLISHDPVRGRDLACGASVLRTRSMSLVLTAAHCLYEGSRPLRRVSFRPGYNGGGPDLGTWPAVRTWVPKRWRTTPYSTALLPYDVGLAGVVKGPRPLERVTGRGLRPYPTRRGEALTDLELLGYLSGGRYSGLDMQRCVADADEGLAAGPGPGVLVTRNCHVADGGSGGPAVLGDRVAGVVSSSGPLRDPAGFTVLTRLAERPFGRMLARADRAMRRL
jgi:hypothetical protein